MPPRRSKMPPATAGQSGIPVNGSVPLPAVGFVSDALAPSTPPVAAGFEAVVEPPATPPAGSAGGVNGCAG
jgi:hypothetical protein